MKKLLSMLGAIGLVVTSPASVVACGSKAGDAGTSGPSKDDVAKWDAMDIREFESLFEDTLDGIGGYEGDKNFDEWSKLGQRLEDIVEKGADSKQWTPQDTKNFVGLFNHFFLKKDYDLLNYGVDRIWAEDKNSELLPELSSLAETFDILENDKSPVKGISDFSMWEELISKAKKDQ